MEISNNIQKTIAVVALSTKILGTPADTKLFEAHINDLVIKGIKRVILDLSQVKRVNSTGLAILITGFNLLTNVGGKFALANMNDFIKGALTITKLDNVLDCYDSLDDAVDK